MSVADWGLALSVAFTAGFLLWCELDRYGGEGE